MSISIARVALIPAFVLALAGGASARTTYVQDGAGLFSATTVATLNTEIGDFAQQTGKEVVVVTVPSLAGSTISTAAENAFSQQSVNGVLIFIAKDEKQDLVVGDRASRAFFPAGSFDAVRQAMRGYFRTGDFDTGIKTGVDLVLSDYRSHEGSLRSTQRSTIPATSERSNVGGGFGGMSMIWLLLILVAGFLVIRAIFRAMSGPRMMPPGYGGPGMGGPGYGGPGMGGPGYGGYGYGGGGGGNFFSGLLGGLGGAWLGNELFNRNAGGGYVDQSGMLGGGSGGGALPPDAGGWQSDAGQADMGNASSGGFGDTGSSGFGDFGGGGGGGDFGGGGDSGASGGW